MAQYRILWEIDVEADSPREAAQEARNIQLDPTSEAVVYTVYHEATEEVYDIDLLEDE